jgi:hypothetical protein
MLPPCLLSVANVSIVLCCRTKEEGLISSFERGVPLCCRFESLAGKEVAKKWKTSVFYLDSDGQAAQVWSAVAGRKAAQPHWQGRLGRQGTWFTMAGVFLQRGPVVSVPKALCLPCACCVLYDMQMMQDWLADHSLDHKVLQALARNLSELKAWERYSQQQGAALLALGLNLTRASPVQIAVLGATARVPARQDTVRTGIPAEAGGPWLVLSFLLLVLLLAPGIMSRPSSPDCLMWLAHGAVADVLNDVVDDVVAAAEDGNGSSAALEQFAGIEGDALAGGTEASAGKLHGNGGQECVEGQGEEGQLEAEQDQQQGQRGDSKPQCSGDGAQFGGQPADGMLQRPQLEKLPQQEGSEYQPNVESQLGTAANGHLSLRADLEMNGDGGRSRGSEPAASSLGQEVEVAEYGRSVSPELKSCMPAEHNEGQLHEQQQAEQGRQRGLAASLERQEGGGVVLGRKRSFKEACGNSTCSNGSSDSGLANGLRQQPLEAVNGTDAPLSRSPGSTLIAPTAAAGSDSQQQQQEQRGGFQEAASARAECIGNGTLAQQQQQGHGQHPEVQLEHGEQPSEAQAQQQQQEQQQEQHQHQQQQQQQQQQQEQQEEEGPAGSDHGMVVDVMCGRLPARFDARCMLVTLRSGQVVSPIGATAGQGIQGGTAHSSCSKGRV